MSFATPHLGCQILGTYLATRLCCWPGCLLSNCKRLHLY